MESSEPNSLFLATAQTADTAAPLFWSMYSHPKDPLASTQLKTCSCHGHSKRPVLAFECTVIRTLNDPVVIFIRATGGALFLVLAHQRGWD